MQHPIRGGHVRDGSGHDASVGGNKASRLPDASGLEGRHIVEAEHVCLVAGCQPPQMVEMVVLGRVARRQHQGVLQLHPGGHRQTHAVVDMAVAKKRVWLAVVGAKGNPVGAVEADRGNKCREVAGGGALTHEDPHPLAPLLLRLVEVGAFVVRLHAGNEVRVKLAPEDPGRVPVDATAACRRYLRQHLRVAVYDAADVHDLGDPERPVHLQQLLELGGTELGPGALERGGGDAARSADAECERKAAGGIGEGHHARDAEDVGDLMRVGRHRRGPVRQHGADKFVDPQLGRLEVHVRVDEGRRQRRSVHLHHVASLAHPPPCDHPVGHGEIGPYPLPSTGDEDPAPFDHQVGRLVAARHGEHPGRPPPRRHSQASSRV